MDDIRPMAMRVVEDICLDCGGGIKPGTACDCDLKPVSVPGVDPYQPVMSNDWWQWISKDGSIEPEPVTLQSFVRDSLISQWKGVTQMATLQQLKTLNMDRVTDLDELVALAHLAETQEAGYAKFALEPPAWIVEVRKLLDKEIRSRRRDYLEMKLREAQQRKEALKTADEKRKDTDAEIARLQTLLNG